MRPQTTSAGRVQECLGWLAATLGGYTWTDADLSAAAATAGFDPDTLRAAKAAMRRADPPLCSRPVGNGRVWVNWIGDREHPNPDRPSHPA